MQEVWILEARRTPIGRFQGGLAGVRPDDLAATVLADVWQRSGVPGEAIGEVLLGCANQAGEDNRNVARMASLLAGLPVSVPAVTVNRLCASGLEAVVQGARQIALGEAELVLAGGVESMSRAPYSLPRGPQLPKAGNATLWDTSLGWRYPNPALAERFPLESMGETAENVAERLGISREAQDAWALRSHVYAVAAQRAGAFQAELCPVPTGRGAVVAEDEGPRSDTSLPALAKLKPAFRSGGTVTAGNASTLNDGAAAVLLGTSAVAQRYGLRRRARLVGWASAGVDPRVMGLGPVPASAAALARAGWTAAEVQAWELNEAFSAQVLGVIQQLDLDPERVNLHGGAIALGHPLGCSGARLVATLLGALERQELTRGAAALCVGVGQGLCALLDRSDAT